MILSQIQSECPQPILSTIRLLISHHIHKRLKVKRQGWQINGHMLKKVTDEKQDSFNAKDLSTNDSNNLNGLSINDSTSACIDMNKSIQQGNQMSLSRLSHHSGSFTMDTHHFKQSPVIATRSVPLVLNPPASSFVPIKTLLAAIPHFKSEQTRQYQQHTHRLYCNYLTNILHKAVLKDIKKDRARVGSAYGTQPRDGSSISGNHNRYGYTNNNGYTLNSHHVMAWHSHYQDNQCIQNDLQLNQPVKLFPHFSNVIQLSQLPVCSQNYPQRRCLIRRNHGAKDNGKGSHSITTTNNKAIRKYRNFPHISLCSYLRFTPRQARQLLKQLTSRLLTHNNFQLQACSNLPSISLRYTTCKYLFDLLDDMCSHVTCYSGRDRRVDRGGRKLMEMMVETLEWWMEKGVARSWFVSRDDQWWSVKDMREAMKERWIREKEEEEEISDGNVNQPTSRAEDIGNHKKTDNSNKGRQQQSKHISTNFLKSSQQEHKNSNMSKQDSQGEQIYSKGVF